MKKFLSVLLTLTMIFLTSTTLVISSSATADKPICLIGDSICKMMRWSIHVDREDIENLGVGGYTSTQVLEKLKTVEDDYEKLFILCGINDKKITGWNYDITESNFREMVSYATENMPGVKIYLISLLPTGGDYVNFVDEGYQAELNARLQVIADENENVTFINCYDALADAETGYYKDDYSDDGLHPNDFLGFPAIGEVLDPYVNEKPETTIDGGDINADGTVDVVDVAMARAHIIKSITLEGDAFTEGDVNSDSVVDIIDVAIMRNYIVNK